MDTLRKEIFKKIAKVVHYVCNNPFIYVSETDLHALMINELFKIPCLNPFKRLYRTNRTIGVSKKTQKPSETKYKTMLVHKEYGHNYRRWERSDVVIFDKKSCEDIDSIKLVSEKNRASDFCRGGTEFKKGPRGRGQYLNPRFIFEFGAETSASSPNSFKKHLDQDLRKISKAQDTGFLIHIHRFFAERRINEKKFEKYKDIVPKALEGYNRTNIKPLILFIKIGNENQIIHSKASMFDGYSIKEPWKKIKLRKVEAEVIKLLKGRF